MTSTYGHKQKRLHGSYWHLPKEAIPEITAALTALGWEVVHAPDLDFH